MRDSLMNAPEATVQDRPAGTRQDDRSALQEAQGTFETGATLWFTGLPSAGKSTIARALARRLADEGRRVQVLDGDEVRPHLSAGLGYGRDDRDVNGLYARARRGEITAMTGVDDPYEVPRTAELVLDTAQVDVEMSVEMSQALLVAIADKELA